VYSKSRTTTIVIAALSKATILKALPPPKSFADLVSVFFAIAGRSTNDIINTAIAIKAGFDMPGDFLV